MHAGEMRAELLTQALDPHAQPFHVSIGLELFQDHSEGLVLISVGQALMYASIADHGRAPLGNTHINEHTIAVLRPVHPEFLEHEGGVVQHVIHDGVVQVHTDLAAGARLRFSNGVAHLFQILAGKEFDSRERVHLKLMSGAFSVPSCALK